jgi:hypothetical protein
MPSTAVASALPMTANCTSCAGVQLTLAPRSSAVGDALARGQLRRDGGTVDAGSVFSTKRAMAMSAPVLPADTHACASPSLTRFTAMRIDESFFLRKASAGGSSHGDDLAARAHFQAIAARASAPWRALRRARLEADQDHARVGVLLQELQRGGHGHGRAVIPPHRVDCDRDRHAVGLVGGLQPDAGARRDGARHAGTLLVGLGLDDFLAAVVPAGG